MINILIALSAGLLIFALMAAAIRKRIQERETVLERMERFAGRIAGRHNVIQKQEEKDLSDSLKEALQKGARLIQKVHRSSSLDLKMLQAGLPILGSEFLIIELVAAIIAFVFAGLLTMQLPVAILAFLFMPLVGWMLIQMKIRKRRKDFVNQLGDMLSMVASALRAGFSFVQAVEIVSKEMAAPMSVEISKLIREINVGVPMETALEDINRRVECPEFELITTAVLIQRQVGGNLAQILDNISDTINERIRMKREVLALTAQGRMSAVVLALLPMALAAFLFSVNHDYFDPLLESSMGKVAIGIALLMELLGYLVIKRIVDIDV
ncbi:MAG: type II secretion system F family protein [Selenomonadaceae bacterium]|nr:type II secretion system F family protein [Selenomonadaceae bacterium]